MANISKPEVPEGSLGTLIDELHQLYRNAGEPSIRDITARTDPKVSRDTVHRTLRSGDLPKFQVLLSVVKALAGDEGRFAELWRAARMSEEGVDNAASSDVDDLDGRSSLSDHSVPIKVMIVDDHNLFRRGVEMVLREVEDCEVVASASDGVEAVEVASAAHPDVVLMDIRMPRMDGISATARLRQIDPSIKVIMVTMSNWSEDLMAALAAGASGYLVKDMELDELPRAIRAVAAGGTVITPGLADSAIRDYAQGQAGAMGDGRGFAILTPREREIVRLVGHAKTDAEISALLSISRNTVAAHIRNITQKTGLGSRGELIRFAIKRGLD